jgi:hypothetical protein
MIGGFDLDSPKALAGIEDEVERFIVTRGLERPKPKVAAL